MYKVIVTTAKGKLLFIRQKEVMRYYSDTFLIILFADIRTTLFLTNFITVTKV